MIPRALPATLAVAALLGCASAPPWSASAPIDWAAVADEAVPTLVTVDPDGGARRTSIWIAVVDGYGFIRTSDTRWFANIERDPDVVLWIGGAAYRLRVRLEHDAAVRDRVRAAFRAKYGLQDRLLHWFGSQPNVMRLEPRPSG